MLRRAVQHLLPLKQLLPETQQLAVSTREASNFFTAPNGPAVKQIAIEDEWYNRQRRLFPLLQNHPYYPLDVFIAPNAVVCGDVDLYGKVSGTFNLLFHVFVKQLHLWFAYV